MLDHLDEDEPEGDLPPSPVKKSAPAAQAGSKARAPPAANKAAPQEEQAAADEEAEEEEEEETGAAAPRKVSSSARPAGPAASVARARRRAARFAPLCAPHSPFPLQRMHTYIVPTTPLSNVSPGKRQRSSGFDCSSTTPAWPRPTMSSATTTSFEAARCSTLGASSCSPAHATLQ